MWSILFDYLDFQKVKLTLFTEAVLMKSGLGAALKLSDIGIQPDGISQIKFITDLLQCMKNLVGTGIFCFITDNRIPEQMIVFPDFSP